MAKTGDIARNLAALMQARGLNAAELCRRAGLVNSAARDILKGRSLNPSAKRLNAFAAALDVPVSALIEDAGPYLHSAPQASGAAQPARPYLHPKSSAQDPLLADLAEAIDLIRATPGDADANDRLVELAVKHAARQSQRQGGAALSTAQQHALLVQVFELLQRARSDPAFLLASANPAPPPPAAPHQAGASAAGRSRAKR